MNEFDENSAGIKRVIVFIIGLIGVLIILFGTYNLWECVTLYRIGAWHNSMFKYAVLTWIIIILIGACVVFLANRLSHRLLPDADDIEKTRIKKTAALEARQKRKEEIDARRREKRAKLAMERANKYNAKHIEEVNQSLPQFFHNARQYRDESKEVVPSQFSIHLFKTGFLLFDVMHVLGLVIAASTVIYGVKHLQYMDTVYSLSKNSSRYYTFLAEIVVVFWIGIIMWLIGKSFGYAAKNCCIAKRNNTLYLVRLKMDRIEEARPVDGFFSASAVGKVINSFAVIDAKQKYGYMVQTAFKQENFEEVIRRIIEEDEYNKLFEVVRLDNSKNVNELFSWYIRKKYLKELKMMSQP